MSDVNKEALKLHEKHKGKIEISLKAPLKTRKDLSLSYTPGVAAVCKEIAKNPSNAYKYTMKANTVAIVTDGSAVLGLGNIGGLASIPVMEGKAALFKEFANIDAIPICFEDAHVDFIQDVKAITPIFGGINLEDIAAPRCFEIEEQLQHLGIPVMHDDQHGTAIVILAGLLNACKVVNKHFEELTVVINGAGAAGYAIAKLLHCLDIDKKICRSVKEIIVCDSKGIISKNREGIYKNKYKYILAQETNPQKREGSLKDALVGADVFIGVSVANAVSKEMITSMNSDPIIFAMANPDPEILPKDAKEAGAAVIGTGRSDFPNQVNNVLAFPGIFRGALDSGATTIDNHMKIAAAYALADYIKKPTADHVIPDILDKNVTKAVSDAVFKAAKESNVCRK